MKSQILISIIWAVFTLMFLRLGYLHWQESKQEMPKFEITKLLGGGTDIKKGGVSIEEPFQDFANEFNNRYLEEQNLMNSEANRHAAYGYFVASLTALFAAVLEWREFRGAKRRRIGMG